MTIIIDLPDNKEQTQLEPSQTTRLHIDTGQNETFLIENELFTPTIPADEKEADIHRIEMSEIKRTGTPVSLYSMRVQTIFFGNDPSLDRIVNPLVAEAEITVPVANAHLEAKETDEGAEKEQGFSA